MAYRDTELWRRKIQAGVRWILSRMEVPAYNPTEIVREMPAHCSLLQFTEREIKVIVHSLDQFFPDQQPLKRRLIHRPDTEFPMRKDQAQFSSDESSSSSSGDTEISGSKEFPEMVACGVPDDARPDMEHFGAS